MSEKIKCEICGGEVHAIQTHLKSDHPNWSLALYKQEYPNSPLLSALAIKKLEENNIKTTSKSVTSDGYARQPLYQIFNLPDDDSTRTKKGSPINVAVLSPDAENEVLVPKLDENYIFETENLKNALMALEINIPLMLWGHTGTGKTTLIEQIAARTKRPAIRIQHTINTEEADIVGQTLVKGGETVFELGPLATAMKYGWVYIADEYDFGLPSVLSVYQPVLEGKALVIKNADLANRVIQPHPDFRFVATGNTNGSGDDTFLYQGTSLQNAANYDRFNMVLEIQYLKPEIETQAIAKQAGIAIKDAAKLVDFATRIRENYEAGKLSMPISTRTLVRIAQIGYLKGGYRAGITLSYGNKMNKVDKEVINGLAQRIFI